MKILKAALLGTSLSHSISPEVHKALFDSVRAKCKTDYESLDYSKIECRDENEFLSRVTSGLKDGFRGFNITFPFKFAASAISEGSSPLIYQIHSANVILCEIPPRIISTDGNGFRYAIEKHCSDFSPFEYSLTILGAGGAARAVFHATHTLGWKRVAIAARAAEEARRAVHRYEEVSVLRIDEIKRDGSKQFIVQATPVGQRTDESLLENFEWNDGDIAVDLVYNPLRTRFLDRAAGMGAKTIDGLGMLIEQAALSQSFWMTGDEADHSLLSNEEFHAMHASLSNLLTPQWDAFVI